ncbi:MAG TPA: hypothetical protein VFO39_14685 [Candidatus Sulfotelmatobacter sp.]|nr:hypothetical protein [Candidatus Sulfotelmatobacter sp.]
MTMNDYSSDQSSSVTEKKTYEKPSFRYEKVFVTTALSCGKVTPPLTQSCQTTPKVS